MAGHFVRWTGNPGQLVTDSAIPQDIIDSAQHLADKRRGRFLAARILLAQLMQRIYGLHRLPPIVKRHNGRPAFADRDLPDFNIAYAGNTVGVLLAEERSQVGLDMDIVRAHSRQTQALMVQGLSSGEIAWINAQQDVPEAVTQIWTLRHSVMKLQGAGEEGLRSLQLLPGAGRRAPAYNAAHRPADSVRCGAHAGVVLCFITPCAAPVLMGNHRRRPVVCTA